jgi:hypothetical protein
MSTTTNGRAPRASLAQQIDRLDLILDNLSEGLQEAVAEAVKTAVTRAVEAALVEVLTNAELRKRLTPETKVASPPNRWETIGTKVVGFAKKCCTSLGQALRALRATVQGVVVTAIVSGEHTRRQVKGCLSGARRQLGSLMKRGWDSFHQVRRSVVLALGIGIVVGVACLAAGPLVASAVRRKR